MKILVIHGPNLNLLGKRDISKYGLVTMAEINQKLENLSKEKGVEIECFQSNSEGEIIDFLQQDSSREAVGILVNPGALIRYAYCFRQALVDHGGAVMEIHMSDINKTEVNKKVNILDDVRMGQVTGLKEESYYQGLEELITHLNNK
ncbi:3-dehydroquinate dehydratase [Candidatus Gracilibacteria bacterium]|nr:3-dehydroquinate dehydratase [Candidatus Gracilibacteria bacterium]